LPSIKDKCVILNEKDFLLSNEEIVKKVSGVSYVSFSSKDSIELPFRQYIQMYGLKKTGLEVSCCDSYISGLGVGNYLSFLASHAFKILPKEEFFSLIDISQIMVTSNYFINHLDKFKNFSKSKEEIIKDVNTCFVGIPLISTKGQRRITRSEFEKCFLYPFVNVLLPLQRQKKAKLFSYLTFLMINSLWKGYPVIGYISHNLYSKIRKKIFMINKK